MAVDDKGHEGRTGEGEGGEEEREERKSPETNFHLRATDPPLWGYNLTMG